MKAGIGSASISLSSGLVVAAIAAVNAVGDVIDPTTGMVVAVLEQMMASAWRTLACCFVAAAIAHRATSGRQHDARGGRHQRPPDEAEVNRSADGRRWAVARGVAVAHNRRWRYRVLACHRDVAGQADITTIGALAADALSEAIVRAAVQATSSGGLPSARDLGSVPARFR